MRARNASKLTISSAAWLCSPTPSSARTARCNIARLSKSGKWPIFSHMPRNRISALGNSYLRAQGEGRRSTAFRLAQLLQGVNIELSHLGGVGRRRGMPYCQTMPNQLTQLTGTYSSAAEGAQRYWSPTGNGVYQDDNTNVAAGVLAAFGGVPTHGQPGRPRQQQVGFLSHRDDG